MTAVILFELAFPSKRSSRQLVVVVFRVDDATKWRRPWLPMIDDSSGVIDAESTAVEIAAIDEAVRVDDVTDLGEEVGQFVVEVRFAGR